MTQGRADGKLESSKESQGEQDGWSERGCEDWQGVAWLNRYLWFGLFIDRGRVLQKHNLSQARALQMRYDPAGSSGSGSTRPVLLAWLMRMNPN